MACENYSFAKLIPEMLNIIQMRRGVEEQHWHSSEPINLPPPLPLNYSLNFKIIYFFNSHNGKAQLHNCEHSVTKTLSLIAQYNSCYLTVLKVFKSYLSAFVN